MKKFGKVGCVFMVVAAMSCTLMGCDSSSSSGNYDRSDSYYRNNDHNDDGYINDNEFQDAVGDYLDDHGY